MQFDARVCTSISVVIRSAFEIDRDGIDLKKPARVRECMHVKEC